MTTFTLIRDHSQSGEQGILLEQIVGMEPGAFLDIGAGDGEMFSNSRALALLGWPGYCVEPAAWAFDRLVELYDDGSGVVSCVQAVLTAEAEGVRRFLYTKDDLLSTLQPDEAAKWPDVPFRVMYAPTLPLRELLDWLPVSPIVVSVDAEGRTSELVRAYMQHARWRDVRLLCFEHEARDLLALPAGFRLVAETPNNVIACRA